MEDDAHAWIVDSGATNHIYSSLQTLSSSTPLRDGDVSMRLGSGEVVSATAVGKARLEFGNRFLILNNVYFIPGFRRNLISISVLHEQLFNISFYNNMIIFREMGLRFAKQNQKMGCICLDLTNDT